MVHTHAGSHAPIHAQHTHTNIQTYKYKHSHTYPGTYSAEAINIMLIDIRAKNLVHGNS